MKIQNWFWLIMFQNWLVKNKFRHRLDHCVLLYKKKKKCSCVAGLGGVNIFPNNSVEFNRTKFLILAQSGAQHGAIGICLLPHLHDIFELDFRASREHFFFLRKRAQWIQPMSKLIFDQSILTNTYLIYFHNQFWNF